MSRAHDTSDEEEGEFENLILLSSSSIGDENEENRALAFRVYEEVWNEFNKWKAEDCKQQLRLLQKPLPPPEVAQAASGMASVFRTGEPGDVETIYLCDTEDDIPLDSGGATVLACNTVSLKLPKKVNGPHPRYEFCTPSVQSISFHVESAACDELETVPFVPYADDPTFNARGYLRQYAQFAWEYLGDPDVEVIQFEVLRRLHLGHGLSLDNIDTLNVLPASRPTNRFGLIYQMTQRDKLFWTGMMAEFPANADNSEQREINPRAHEPGINDLRKRIDSIVPYFCANPCCVQALCPHHERVLPPIPPAVPRIASDSYPKGSPCGSLCFRKFDSTFQKDCVEWGDAEIDELLCILEILPDTVPCGLAKLVKRPCREVFVYRCRLIPDAKIYPESSTSGKKASNNFKNCIEHDYTPPDPCSHSGPCDINNSECICAKESVHCTRNCRCSTACQRRGKGCRCDQKSKCAAGAKCECRKRGWECDPMVCKCGKSACKPAKSKSKKTGAGKQKVIYPDGKHNCQNSDLQRGVPAKLKIKRGAFGLGAFAVEKIRKDQFIGEYIGELIPMKDDKKEILRKHIGLNYSFTLNDEYVIDSARVGNETRYINHAAEPEANATAIKKLVFGDLRIAFYATKTIKAGNEILFDYGENYWT